MINGNFAALHTNAEPLVLFNVWDAGSARMVAEAGASAIATGSFSMAGAQGYDDGEALPFADLLRTVEQISRVTDLPLSVDIESGYAASLEELATNAAQLISAGASGCNLEDQLVGQHAMRDADDQCRRIEALTNTGIFVNARTDLFLGPLMAGEDPNHPDLVDAAVARAGAYRDAGANCLFVPGLSDKALISDLCARVELPVNVMRSDGMASNAELGRLGVARISFGPQPWRDAMANLRDQAIQAM